MKLIVVTNSTCKCCVTYKQKLSTLREFLDSMDATVEYVDINRHPEVVLGYEEQFRGLPLTIVRDSEGKDLGLLRGDVVENYFRKRIAEFAENENQEG